MYHPCINSARLPAHHGKAAPVEDEGRHDDGYIDMEADAQQIQLECDRDEDLDELGAAWA